MTFRLYDELIDSLENEFTLHLDGPIVVKGIYPYLYVKNAPLGTFTFSLESQGVQVFSKSFTSEYIKASLETDMDSSYVFFPVLANPYLLLGKGKYKAKLTATDYFYSENSHIGWIRLHKHPVNKTEYVPQTDNEINYAMKMKVTQRPMYL